MKRVKSIFLIALASLLLFQVPVLADTPTVLYDNIANISAGISRSGSTATCSASYILSSSNTAAITMTLQKSTDNSTFTKVTAWTGMHTGTGLASMTKVASLDKGYYYRVKVALKIYSGATIVETATLYSHVISYK
jgi:hypothetical protein